MAPKQKPGRSKQDYETPADLIAAIKQRFAIENFAFDFAADSRNTKAKKYWSVLDDSLSKSPEVWAQQCREGWGWLNPPFANIKQWAWRCRAAMNHGADILLLVPASVGSGWYRDYIDGEPGVKVSFLNGRPHFDKQHPTWGYPKDCMLVCFIGSFREAEFVTECWNWRKR
jgi:phage N-6-adenine-methyltransferase